MSNSIEWFIRFFEPKSTWKRLQRIFPVFPVCSCEHLLWKEILHLICRTVIINFMSATYNFLGRVYATRWMFVSTYSFWPFVIPQLKRTISDVRSVNTIGIAIHTIIYWIIIVLRYRMLFDRLWYKRCRVYNNIKAVQYILRWWEPIMGYDRVYL